MTDLIQRAERALRTGQPNLAMVYMRRGLEETADGRAWLAWTDFKSGVIAAARDVGIFLDDPAGAIVQQVSGQLPDNVVPFPARNSLGSPRLTLVRS